MNNETVHTYTITWRYDTEETNPISAGLEYLHRVRELSIEPPIVTVKQFTDTDKTPKVYDVDLYGLTATRVDPTAIRIWILTETDNTGGIERMQVFTSEEMAINAHAEAMIKAMDDGSVLYGEDQRKRAYHQLVASYLAYAGEAHDPGRIDLRSFYATEVGHGL